MITKQNEFLEDLCKLIQFAQASGFVVTGGELFRPPEMQVLYVKQGKSRTLGGQHGKRLACDLNFFKSISGKLVLTYDKKDIEPIGKYWESLRQLNRWGGNFKSLIDTPHFERKEE